MSEETEKWRRDFAESKEFPAATYSAEFECCNCSAKVKVSCNQPNFKVYEFQCGDCGSLTLADREMHADVP